ncbi:3'-5' exonuclease [Fimbriiglobus ruber]|uniref:DNA Pol III Epsilon Chain n=1 Tax=Fimbriiglobus ruber TaxID=1908690 RepID=A0A225DBJ0_9BACT|nr:3'-5' exonuclease [Fimbriiglobus ruber]OWK34666.1 DNA Pol III Epsilon Chain [Fimbriiglobus ruber]
MRLTFAHLALARPLAVLDLETTGVDPARDRVVEFAVLKIAPDGRSQLCHQRVRPGVPIPAAATAVHGITDRMVDTVPPFRVIARSLAAFLADTDLAGFGIAGFDLPILAAEFARAGVSFRVAGRAVVDALTVFHRHEPRDLGAAVRLYLGRDHPNAHAAAADARVAAAVLDAQVGRYGLPPTPPGLHATLVEVDVGRRFRRGPGGGVDFAFGKHAGRSLADVARTDPGYLEWMLGQAFLDDAHALVRRALAGQPLDVPNPVHTRRPA